MAGVGVAIVTISLLQSLSEVGALKLILYQNLNQFSSSYLIQSCKTVIVLPWLLTGQLYLHIHVGHVIMITFKVSFRQSIARSVP